MPISPLPELRATFFLEERLSHDPAIGTHGVVLDVPVDGALDTLAAYADGTARYINHSGKAIIWESPDTSHPIRDLVKRLLAAADKTPRTPLRRYGQPMALDVSGSTATVLTTGGLIIIPLGRGRLSEALMGLGVALMQALIEQMDGTP